MAPKGFAYCKRTGCRWELMRRKAKDSLEAERDRFVKYAKVHLEKCSGPVTVHVAQYVFVTRE